MKLSVSLPVEDVEFIDDYSQTAAVGSRSAAIRVAVQRLRESLLADEYAQMYSDPAYLAEAAAWDATLTDGLSDEAW